MPVAPMSFHPTIIIHSSIPIVHVCRRFLRRLLLDHFCWIFFFLVELRGFGQQFLILIQYLILFTTRDREGNDTSGREAWSTAPSKNAVRKNMFISALSKKTDSLRDLVL